jgi:hypothetical protein
MVGDAMSEAGAPIIFHRFHKNVANDEVADFFVCHL